MEKYYWQPNILLLQAPYKGLGQTGLRCLNANPGLKVNWGNKTNYFSCIKLLSIASVLCSFRLLMLKTEGQ